MRTLVKAIPSIMADFRAHTQQAIKLQTSFLSKHLTIIFSRGGTKQPFDQASMHVYLVIGGQIPPKFYAIVKQLLSNLDAKILVNKTKSSGKFLNQLLEWAKENPIKTSGLALGGLVAIYMA